MENLQFSFTLKTDDDCFVNVEAIIAVSVCNVFFISSFVLYRLGVVPLHTSFLGIHSACRFLLGDRVYAVA